MALAKCCYARYRGILRSCPNWHRYDGQLFSLLGSGDLYLFCHCFKQLV